MPKKPILGDYHYRRAKEMGYRSRSALKLREIFSKHRIVGKGDVVLDLGAAPGGWLQVAREYVGEKGLVVGVDLARIAPLPFNNVVLIQGDITSPATVEKIAEALPKPVDVVLSDVAPKFTGIHDLDHARQIHLARVSLRVAVHFLKDGGHAVFKVLMGREFRDFLEELQKHFSEVITVKPRASRLSSAEVYVVCKGFKRMG